MKLRVNDLSVDTPDGSRVIEDVSFQIEPGQSVGITGPSGAGKSTLLFALAGLIVPRAGSIIWNTTDISDLPEAERTAFRRDMFGIVFQDHLLFDELSPLQNADIATLFGRGLGSSVDTLTALNVPNTRKRSAQLSGGERQRVAIARALSGNPNAVLADEPSASLDHETRSNVLEILFDQTTGSGKTLLIVSHDPQILYRMDRVLTLEDGRLS